MDNLFAQIEKPTLLLDQAAARRNLHHIAERARSAGVVFRPHFKTHQSAEIGEWFREEGIGAITVSSADMALYFCENGWDDVIIAFPANVRQRDLLASLASRIHLGLLVESVETVRALDDGLKSEADAWIKVDAGLHRTGLPWEQPELAAQVARAVQASRRLHLRGLLTHGGQTYTARGAEEVCQKYQQSVERIDQLRQELRKISIAPLQISVGDTPGASLCSDLGPVDEIRPGNFIFYDAQQIQIGSCRWEDVAVVLACPVVARHPERNELTIYGGAVHLSKDFWVEDERRAYGLVCLPDPQTGRWGAPLPGARVTALSQEHGVIRLAAEEMERIQVGDLVCILPAHSCLTVTLMKRYLTLDGRVIDTMNV